MTTTIQDAVNNSYAFKNYLDKSLKHQITANDTCFSEEESDSSNSTKSFENHKLGSKKKHVNTTKKEDIDSDNDSLIEYSKKKKMNSEPIIENEKKQKSLYKTELCRNWEETGQCRYGMKCQYAHGSEDLREIERHPKYKTQKCRTFHKTGSCPYGARCTFRHFSLPSDALDIKEQEEQELYFQQTESKKAPIMFPSVFNETSSTPWYSNIPSSSTPLNYDLEDSLLPSNAESLLPHQLLFDLDDQPYNTTFSQIPSYQHVESPLCKSFFRPWLF